MTKVLSVFLLFSAANAGASSIRELKSIDCSFDNSVTIQGERTKSQYSDIQVETNMGFSTETMRASLDPSGQIEIKGAPAAVDLDGGGGASYYFKGNLDVQSDAPQTVRGTLTGWAGKTSGTCRVELITGELRL